MAWEDTGQIAPLTAGAAIAALVFVKVGASDNNVITVAASTDTPVGINKLAAASGAAAGIQISGVSRVLCGAAVTRGSKLMSDASGRVINFVAGAGNTMVGIALEAGAAANSIISIEIDVVPVLT